MNETIVFVHVLNDASRITGTVDINSVPSTCITNCETDIKVQC